MKCYSVSFSVPDQRPCDRQESWFQSFVGGVILPISELPELGRFWFTRYGAVGKGKHALFRFETGDIDTAMTEIRAAARALGFAASEHEKYVPASDIGKGEGSRFLGTNAKHQDPARRGDLALTFLYASARLMLDCLVGPDSDGYFALESETVSGFSRESSLEQFHHLFCNMTCVPTFLAVAQPPKSTEIIPITYEERKMFNNEAGWRFGGIRRGQF